MIHLKQIFSYLTVGLLAAIVNFLAFGLLLSIIGFHYKLSASIAYVLAVTTHFLGNRHFTFKSSSQSIVGQLQKYAVVLACNYLITLATITGCVELLHLSPYMGMITAIGLTVGSGYLLSQRWIFMA